MIPFEKALVNMVVDDVAKNDEASNNADGARSDVLNIFMLNPKDGEEWAKDENQRCRFANRRATQGPLPAQPKMAA
jgi:hypothetical protein